MPTEELAPTNPGLCQPALEFVTKVRFPLFKRISTDGCLAEVPDGWANLYACPNNTNQVFTCGSSGWASKNCDEHLGTYHWVHANVSVAQLGQSVSTTASSATTITETVTAAGTSRVETVTSESSNTVGLGAGLGVGLGVPLLLVSAGLLWFFLRTRRQMAGMQVAAVQSAPVGYAGWQGQEKPTEVEGTTPSRTELPVNME